jgi:hypothetical protein
MHIEIIRYPDCEGDDNRGFMVDRLHIHINGQNTGYLAMAHIPFHRMVSWYDQEFADTALKYYAATRQRTVKALLKSGERLGLPPTLSRDKCLTLMRKFHGRLTLPGGGNIVYHLDRPYVDYIRIYDETDWVRSGPPLRFYSKHQEPKYQGPNYRRHGLGTLLYSEGARWMQERGMLLYASDLQQPEARMAWERMETRFPGAVLQVLTAPIRGNEEERWRIALDGAQLPDWLPTGAQSFSRHTMPSGRTPESNNIWDLDDETRLRFEENEREALAQGRNPSGGEVYPKSPAEALTSYQGKH